MALAQILVVDDELLIRETLAEFLEQEHYAVRTCGSGEEAVAAIRQSPFDVVLCDVNLNLSPPDWDVIFLYVCQAKLLVLPFC